MRGVTTRRGSLNQSAFASTVGWGATHAATMEIGAGGAEGT